LYIKDNNVWEKENEEKQKLKKAIKHISIRNAKQVGEWTKENKGYDNSSNKTNNKYLKIVSEANGGEPEEINKIISNVSNHITIDKQI
jgi:flagellar motility protein MotE (MotC chaperone)